MAQKNFIQFLMDTEHYDELDSLQQLAVDYYTSDEDDDFDEKVVEDDFVERITRMFSEMDSTWSRL